ncbi:MAG: hypothetical protein NVV82_14170 [Sporocytophaga sp.]|nr:hypothetical protein [Sporocytophaga sp.]
MDINVLSKFFIEKISSINEYKENITEVIVRPEICDSYGRPYFRTYVDIKHNFMLPFKPRHEYSENDHKNYRAYLSLNGYSNTNGEQFVSGQLTDNNYLRDLQKNFDLYKTATAFFCELFKRVLNDSNIELTIISTRDLPHEKYLDNFLYKLDYSKSAFYQIFGEGIEEKVSTDLYLQELDISRNSSDNRNDYILLESDLKIIFEGEYYVAVIKKFQLKFIKDYKDIRYFNIYEVYEIFQSGQINNEKSKKFLEEKIKTHVASINADIEKKEKLLKSLPVKMGDILICKKSWGSNELMLVKLLEIDLSYRVDLKCQFIKADLKVGLQKKNVEMKDVLYVLSESEYNNLTQKSALKNSAAIIRWGAKNLKPLNQIKGKR